MNINLWIFLLTFQAYVTSSPIQDRYDISAVGIDPKPGNNSPELPKYEDTSDSVNEKVISVSITSSVAVGRGKEQLPYRSHHQYEQDKILPTATSTKSDDTSQVVLSHVGANVEYIKQLNAKKETRDHHTGPVHPFQLMVHGQTPIENESSLNHYNDHNTDVPIARKVPSSSDVNHFHEYKENRGYQLSAISGSLNTYHPNGPINLTEAMLKPPEKYAITTTVKNDINVVNETVAHNANHSDRNNLRGSNLFISEVNNYQTDDSIAESSIKSVEFSKTMATVPPSTNYIHNLADRPNTEQNNPRLTTVSFNVIHDATKTTNINEPSNSYVTTSQVVPHEQQIYDSPKIYSQPSKIYSEPAKFYSEPAKMYSEPAKVYSEPAKVYSEPSKVYSEPAKFYSEPASLHLNENFPVPPSIAPNYSPWLPQRSTGSSTLNTTPITTIANGYQSGRQMEHQPERNYEIDEKISVLTDGRSHGVQESTTEKCKQDNCKVGYVVEGRQYKKYRVEERTADGFIVGEYGVVRNEDGALRGVRYTADSDASPRLIHDALMKFLQLK